MAVYNAESFLLEAIESILGQSFDDLEVVIVDDGSTETLQRQFSPGFVIDD